MSYGVNKWAASSGHVRAAGKPKRRARRTGRKSSRPSARPAKKRKGASSRKRSSAKRKRRATKRSTARRAPKKKPTKERLFTRYDPETGQKVRVTKDTFEYAEWPSRKPSKKKIQRAALRADPIGTVGQLGTLAGKKAVERAGERAGRDVLRAVGRATGVGGALGASRAAATAALPTVAAVGAILAAGYYVSEQIAKRQSLKLGDRLNAISARFVETQRQLIKVFGDSWDDVPADVRSKAVAEYKRAIATASSRAQGSALAGVRAVGSYK